MSKNGSAPKATNGATPPADQYSSGYDFLLVNSEIAEITFPQVMNCVHSWGRNKKLVLILVTYGGDANTAYRIGRYLQTVYDDIVAFVPAECKSAGTLLVTAANSIVIAPFGEIGPLDVQLVQRDELGGRRSGLTTRSALDELKSHSFELFEHIMQEIKRKSVHSISFRLAADIAGRMSSDLLARIYDQINPADLGQDNRDLNVALQYGERLDRRFANLKPRALRRLVYDYPSHDFVIDIEEADGIFHRVELPTATLVNLIGARTTDCLFPKVGRNRVIEMLTSTGQTVELAEQTTAPDEKTGDQGHDEASTRRGSDGGEAATA